MACNCKCHKNKRIPDKEKKEEKEKDGERDNIFRNIWFILALSVSLFVVGILGFYLFNEPDWVTATYDAASIMSAVGAADEPHTVAGKIFASFYTLFSGLLYIFIISYFVTSVIISRERYNQ